MGLIMAGFTDDQVRFLTAPLARQHVRERVGAGRKFSYIEGWHAIAEANRIFGFDCWDRETVDIRCVAEAETKIGPRADRQGNPIAQKDGHRVAYICKARITTRAGDRAVVREGSGYGSGIDIDLGQAHESALKEAETDAMKRALMTFGNPFGLALYDKEQTNVVDGHADPLPRSGTGSTSIEDRSRNSDTRPASGKARVPPGDELSETELQYARDAWARLHKAMDTAKLPKMIDEIVSLNAADLEKIKAASPDAYGGLMEFATARKTEMLASA